MKDPSDIKRNLAKDFLEKGFCVFDIENKEYLEIFSKRVKKVLNENKLQELHKNIPIKEINSLRINAFRELNKINDWENKYNGLGKDLISFFLGRDLAIQNKLNLSIQMPNDTSSVLDLHTDALSGESVFEIVLWVPLTKSFDSNAMYIFDPKTSKIMLSEMPKNERIGMKLLYEKFKGKANFINVEVGQGVIFSPTMFHGNVLNKTSSTRVSINCRFKNIFSHEAASGERRLGSFYKILTTSEITKLGLSYRDDLIEFQ